MTDMPMLRAVDHDFFRSWNSDMAYVLGFFAADGCMIKNNRGAHFIEFHITDKELLFAIRKVMKSNHKIAIRTRNPKHKIGYRIQIGSIKMYNDLRMLGFSSRKSLNLRMPNVPSKYLGDFVRGYFDGDGCIYFKKHFVKAREKHKWIFSTRFTCGSRAFFVSLLKELRGRGLNRGFIMEKYKQGGYELVFSHRDSVALFHLMYNNVPDNGLCLARKFKKYQVALRTLYGENAGVAQR